MGRHGKTERYSPQVHYLRKAVFAQVAHQFAVRYHGRRLKDRYFNDLFATGCVPGAVKLGNSWCIRRKEWDSKVADDDWDWIPNACEELNSRIAKDEARRELGQYVNEKKIRGKKKARFLRATVFKGCGRPSRNLPRRSIEGRTVSVKRNDGPWKREAINIYTILPPSRAVRMQCLKNGMIRFAVMDPPQSHLQSPYRVLGDSRSDNGELRENDRPHGGVVVRRLQRRGELEQAPVKDLDWGELEQGITQFQTCSDDVFADRMEILSMLKARLEAE